MKAIKIHIIPVILLSGVILVLSCKTYGGIYTGQHSLNGERNKDSVVGIHYAEHMERQKPQRVYQNQGEQKQAYSDQGAPRARGGVVLRKESYSGPKELIAVMDFTTRDVPLSVAFNVSELIRTELINTGRFTVLERSQMKEILKEQGFQQTGCTETACAVQMGKLLSARKILIGSVMKLGAKLIISGRVVDVEKGVGDQGAKGRASSIDDLDDGVVEFINNLSGL